MATVLYAGKEQKLVPLAVKTHVEIPFIVRLRMDDKQQDISFDPVADVPQSFHDQALKHSSHTFMEPSKTIDRKDYKVSDKWKDKTLHDVVNGLSDAHKIEILELAKEMHEDEQRPITAGATASNAAPSAKAKEKE